MATEAPVNGVGTNLATGYPITSTATSWSLASATGFTNAQYRVLITDGTNFEIAEATALSGTTLTVTRAVESYGGVQTAHAFADGPGTTITVVPSVASVQNLIDQSTIPGTQVPNVVALVAQSATPAYNTDTANIQRMTGLAQAVTSFTSGHTGTLVLGQEVEWQISDNGVAQGLTFGTLYTSVGIPYPTMTVPGKTIYLRLAYNPATASLDLISTSLAASSIPTGGGSPSGVVTPTSIGELYIDNTSPGIYQATGLVNTDWAQVVSFQYGITQFVGGSGSIQINGGLIEFQTGYLKTGLVVGNGSPVGVAGTGDKGSLYFDNASGLIWKCTVSGYPATWIPLSWGDVAPSTVAGTAGSLTCSQPFQGTNYKKSLVIVGSTFTSSTGVTYIFPTPFLSPPVVVSSAITGATVTVTTTGVTITVATALGSAYGISIEGN